MRKLARMEHLSFDGVIGGAAGLSVGSCLSNLHIPIHKWAGHGRNGWLVNR